MKKRIFSRVLALVMAMSLLSTTAFAASFSQLQDAIDGQEGQMMDNGHTGYAWNEGLNHWGIEAWDDGDNRNVQLNEDVQRTETEETGISISGSNKDVTIDLNGQTIDGSNQNGSVITVTDGGKLTVEDSSGKNENGEYIGAGDGKITGGTGEAMFKNPNGDTYAGGGVYVKNSEFTLNGGNITGNKSDFGRRSRCDHDKRDCIGEYCHYPRRWDLSLWLGISRSVQRHPYRIRRYNFGQQSGGWVRRRYFFNGYVLKFLGHKDQ